MDKTITIKEHQAGQPKPYADSIFEWTITFSWPAPASAAKQVASALRYGAKVAEKGKQENWAQGYFDLVRSDGDGWRVRIVEPYTD